MSQDQIRIDQQQDGHRRSGTLHTRPGYGNKTAPARKSFVAKGHDAILKGIQDEGGTIVITTLADGGVIRGKLVARDKFTITVLRDNGRKTTIYKHAIESFESANTVQ